MEKHPNLARRAAAFMSSMGAARKVALWQEVTVALNALVPAVKTVKLWRKYWSRLCYDSRKLTREIERERRTGGTMARRRRGPGAGDSRQDSARLRTGPAFHR
ncbi:hypothetical protein MTO96_032936 [Rhipicephalus appendiculatus]